MFPNFPYTNYHRLNTDWMVARLKELNITQEDIDRVEQIYAEFSPYTFPTVKTYGAKGDGVTDDTQAFIDCISNESVIVVPPGKYYLYNPIIASAENKIIVGFPRAEIITGLRWEFNNCNNISVCNLDFMGSADALAYRKALQFYRCMDINVCNCSANNYWSVGFDFVTTGRAEVRDSIIYNVQPTDGSATGAGIQMYYEAGFAATEYVTGYHKITGCIIHDTGIDSILANTNNIDVSNCILYNAGLSVPAAAIYANRRERLNFNNNTVSDCRGNGIDVVNSYHVTIADSIVKRCNCAGILTSGGGNIIIENCVSNENGLAPGNFQNQDSGISILNNTAGLLISDCSVAGNRYYGIRLHSQTGAVISNILYGPNDAGSITANDAYQTPTMTTITP